MTAHRFAWIGRILSCLIFLYPSIGHAWLYEEHAWLTNNAFNDACSQVSAEIVKSATPDVQSKLARLNLVCGAERATTAECFGHMTSLAGDHTENAEELAAIMASDSKFLHDGRLDCRDFPDPIVKGASHIVEPKVRSAAASGDTELRNPEEIGIKDFDNQLWPHGLFHILEELRNPRSC